MTRIGINIPAELLDQIRKYCEERDIKISGLLRQGARAIIQNDINKRRGFEKTSQKSKTNR